MSVYDNMTPEQIEAYREYHRQYYRKNRDRIAQRVKDNRVYDREHVLQREAAWRNANRDKVNANAKRCYEKRKRKICDLEAQNAELRHRIAELEAWIDAHIKA